ncbi:ATP-binding protein [Pseudomonas aeruginosa]|uniref:ATP-binding protein n=1 Tax=Pseudomonas aeruginosa TaxID=287 RepID=UPI00192D8BE8|nr:ATP-binding protein [Pseudomonas aeruginosa]
MSNYKLSASTNITSHGIRKHFKKVDSWQPIFELAWNGFDAKATRVDIDLASNDAGGLEYVSVLDNGIGIDFLNAENNFGKFNESSKIGSANQHGSHGRGRLAFHVLCSEARWYTRNKKDGDAIITVNSSDLAHYEVQGLDDSEQHSLLSKEEHGTCVELINFTKNIPTEEDLLKLLSVEFGWYLVLNKDKSLFLNGCIIPIPEHELTEREVSADNQNFLVKVIRWVERPSSEKSLTYLKTNEGATVHKELSKLNNKPNFFTSVYVISDWADSFREDEDGLLSASFNPTCKTWKLLQRELENITQKIYDEFLKKFVDRQIDKFEEEGVFPDYSKLNAEEAAWRSGKVRSTVRSIYLADPSVFNTLQKKQKKILIRLIDRLLISSENDALLEVLESTLELDQESTEKLAKQIKSIKLENIVATIEVIHKRQVAVHQLREIMGTHYLKVLETPDLQRIIENNTWLFGPSYEILGAEETTFTALSKDLRNRVKGIQTIGEDDLEESDRLELDVSQRQPDLFLARKIPAMDSYGKQYYRCVIIEIKRPSVALNIKHLRQLDDYADIIKKFPDFTSGYMHVDLILVGRKISEQDTEIKSRQSNHISKGEMGLVSDDPRMKRYVKDWYTILDEFELKNNFMLEKLKLQRSALELEHETKEALVEQLQAKDCTHATDIGQRP